METCSHIVMQKRNELEAGFCDCTGHVAAIKTVKLIWRLACQTFLRTAGQAVGPSAWRWSAAFSPESFVDPVAKAAWCELAMAPPSGAV